MPHSLSQTIPSSCPQCGQPIDLPIWLIVDLAERPDLAERIREGTLHDTPCPHCGHVNGVDAPLLIHDPARRRVFFSPAQQTTAEQDREHAAGLLDLLRRSLGDAWQDEWLESLASTPRELVPTLLDGGDPEAALRAMLEKAAQEMERLRQEDPERFAELEQAARQMVEPTEAGDEGDLVDLLIAWIQQDTLDDAQAYLHEHAADLLTDAAAQAMDMLVQANPLNPNVSEHRRRLAHAREVGIEAMYAEIRQARWLDKAREWLQQKGPIGAAVARLVQAGDDDQAAALLQSEAHLLLTLDAGDMLRQLVEAAQQAGDEALAARLAARLAQQQAARLGGEPPARPDPRGQQMGVQANIAGDAHGQAGNRYEIGLSMLSAVGDGAIALNLVNFGPLTLRWQRPQMARLDLTERAVGRGDELDALRGRQDVAIVGKRTQAVSGMPGVGKSTLAALYADECAADLDAYPGGVLWLQLGPDFKTPESVQSALSALVGLIYGLSSGHRFQLELPHLLSQALREQALPPQAIEQLQRLMQTALFTPEATQRLLAGHGRLLLVVDDLWERALWPPLRRALPADAHVLVTTRDDRVAQAVGRALPLDVLSDPDALALIAQELPPMPRSLAVRLIQVVGAHPMALNIALGDLHPADPPKEWAAAVEHIAGRLARGLGVNPTTLDDIEPQRRLDEILAYSYEALAVSAPLQTCFLALGSLAAEADWDTAAAAALLEQPPGPVRELLKALRDRNLLRRRSADSADCWQQHAILRSYALEQQGPAERLAWAERHARHYLARMRAADDAQTYYTMRPDLPNLRHAFAWAAGEGRALGLAQDLLGRCANLLKSQNLGGEYLAWAEQVRSLAWEIGGKREQGQALVSLGNALQAAATLADRAARLRQALAAYDEALALRRDVPLDYAQTQNNRANVLSDLAGLPGEDRAARLRQALADAASAVHIFELVQQAQYLQVGRRVLAGVVVALGAAETRAAWASLTDRPFPALPAELLVGSLAEQSGIASQQEFAARLQNDPAFRRQVEELAALAAAQTGAPGAAQGLADLLIAWIVTPDWHASEEYLRQHQASLLTDQAAAVLERLQQGNPDRPEIPQHQTLLRRCREIGIGAAYQELLAALAAARQAAQRRS